MLRVRNLSKNFKGLLAVENMTFSINNNEIYGILGPNNSGKTVTAKMLAGLIPPTSGVIEFNDFDLAKDPELAKQIIGYVPKGNPFYAEMRVSKFLNFVAEIKGFCKSTKEQRVAEVLESMRLQQCVDSRISTLSQGYKCKLAIAQALLHDPEVLVLDEPSAELDANQRHEIRTLLRELAKEKIIIFATRNVADVEDLCDKVAVIASGKLIIESTPLALAQQSPLHNTLQLKLEKASATGNIIEKLQTIQEVERVEYMECKDDEMNLLLYPKEKYISLPKVQQLAADLHWKILDLKVMSGCLEEVFRTITTRYQPVG